MPAFGGDQDETPEVPALDGDAYVPRFDEYTGATKIPEINKKQIDRITNKITNKITNTPKFAPFGTPKWKEDVENLIEEEIEETLGNA